MATGHMRSINQKFVARALGAVASISTQEIICELLDWASSGLPAIRVALLREAAERLELYQQERRER